MKICLLTLGWEKGVSVMDQVTSIAKKWLGKHGYMGLTSALEYFTQKRTKLLKAQHSDRSWSGQELSSRGAYGFTTLVCLPLVKVRLRALRPNALMYVQACSAESLWL